jgi:protocatechuate 3,4-dioxygenase alpha subunit
MTVEPLSDLTPSQTAGPFFADCLLRRDARRQRLSGAGTPGTSIRIEGRVLDGDGAGIPDALVEIWQANSRGRYNHPADRRGEIPLDPGFIGFGRCGTDDSGGFWFETIKPGAVPLSERDRRMQAPHICVTVFARGLLNHVATRLYFADEPANSEDPILQLVHHDRRQTLLAQPRVQDGTTVYCWDIVLQGTGETVFFNV